MGCCESGQGSCAWEEVVGQRLCSEFMRRPILILWAVGLAFMFSCCANQQGAQGEAERVHGSVGVEMKSRDFSRYTGSSADR